MFKSYFHTYFRKMHNVGRSKKECGTKNKYVPFHMNVIQRKKDKIEENKIKRKIQTKSRRIWEFTCSFSHSFDLILLAEIPQSNSISLFSLFFCFLFLRSILYFVFWLFADHEIVCRLKYSFRHHNSKFLSLENCLPDIVCSVQLVYVCALCM